METKKKRSCKNCKNDKLTACNNCVRIASGGYLNNWVGKKPVKQGVNPKEIAGSVKNPHCCVSLAVMAEVGIAMMEGARKYGRYNYRDTVITASIYYDAVRRHIDLWWEGEDIDPESGIHHITKAIAGLTVLRDGLIQNKVDDDRPPITPPEHWKYIKKITATVLKKYPDCKLPFTQKGIDDAS
ncbi:hypothetical protein LCGC14_0487120 [marine sediment metagenome]|uniref:dATP/dGTP diphosphohydrolase N-terminal domain-containing protein n=1 Tax=marine sediment metagenome TaxID=412755 RepID=A0A0F9VGG9_9ZZZZ